MIDRWGTVTSFVDAARHKVLREISRDDSVLGHVLSRPSVRSLDSDARTRLGGSVANDRALLAELATEARAAPTLVEVQEVASRVRQLRPGTYIAAVGQLHDLAEVAEAANANAVFLDDLEAIATEREDAGRDMAAVRADLRGTRPLNSEVILAVPAARDAALLLTATSTRAEIGAVTSEVLRTVGLLESVDSAIMLVELAIESPRVSWRLGYLEPARVGTGDSGSARA